MASIQGFVMEALKNHDGLANLSQIYEYVSEQMNTTNMTSVDYQHTVRGTLYRLIKQGKVMRGNKPTIYKLITLSDE